MRGRIVCTSAYPDLTEMVREVAEQLSIEMFVVEAVLEDVVTQVGELIKKDQVDVLVSRGGTEQLLKRNFDIPVVSIAPSEFDVFQALAKAATSTKNIGYLSHPDINNPGFLDQAQTILRTSVKHYPYRTVVELTQQMKNAHRDGCDAVVGGGYLGVYLAREFGMEGFLVYSSRSTVATALKQADEIASSLRRKRAEEEKQQKIVWTKGFVAHFSFEDLVGHTLLDTIHKAEGYSKVDATVLIWGESGTGKEILAQSIHSASPRSKGPFVAVNCAGMPENLLESELFGYEEGAFTGAKKGGRKGLFEMANGGTVFLDEIGKMPMEVQSRMLRVLQTKEVRRIGGDRILPVNVRVIAASNEELGDAVKTGGFRSDLYYRLNVLNLRIPPLRDRLDDIPCLVEEILARMSVRIGYRPKLSPEFAAALQEYQWPGNVRELENVLERYTVLYGNSSHPDFTELISSFPELTFKQEGYKTWGFTQKEDPIKIDEIVAPSVSQDIIEIEPGTLEEMESQLIAALIQRYNGNKTLLAEKLGISRTTLWKKVKNWRESKNVSH